MTTRPHEAFEERHSKYLVMTSSGFFYYSLNFRFSYKQIFAYRFKTIQGQEIFPPPFPFILRQRVRVDAVGFGLQAYSGFALQFPVVRMSRRMWTQCENVQSSE